MDPRQLRSCSSSYVSTRIEEEKVITRCCSDCKTTKTPMWRGGPTGPKSLCNACGIRFRKQRRSELLAIRIIHSHKVLDSKKIKPKSSSLSSSHGGVAVKKQRYLKEIEQAALCLLLLSCSSDLA
ncbi:PREDICTED: GATA transcription factor 23-like [Camelina sativa]|uniref:GATA transcription factor 23-like n=1 Tax=Camelina sativa TaxID=90675 RepID=A0ABM0Y1A2_CAMSA|nr:PREDICTED: GATA transcription factor 23-like [Camelina sativa]